MNYLVLGSEGFIGKPLCNYLRKKGNIVTGIDIKLGDEMDLRKCKIDLTDIDQVLFLAWDVGGSKYLYKDDNQLHQLEWNIDLMRNTFPQLSEANTPFLFVSSQLADDVDTVYGITKRLGEHWTQLYGGTLVRFWNVYGPIENTSERSHVISDMIHNALTFGEIKLLTDGMEKRQFIHIDDVCRAVEIALSQSLTGVFDITSFYWISILDVAEMIAIKTGAIVTPGSLIGKTQRTSLSGRILGWFPEVSMEEGISRMICSYYKESE